MALTMIFGLIGWSYLPDLATRKVLELLYTKTKLIPSPPPLHTPRYVAHYRWTFAGVVLAYLLYNLAQSSSSIEPNFYEILGVPNDVDENELKSAFRQFAKRYHPDRVGQQGGELFMAIRDAFEALKDPVVRFAYDRFGADVLTWKNLSTPKEYLEHGVIQSSGYHIVSFIALFIFSAIGRPSPVTFWRFLLYVSFMIAEVSLLLSPSTSPEFSLLKWLFPSRVPFQHVKFLHNLFIFASIALSRVAPVVIPPAPPDRITSLAATADRDATFLLQTEIRCIHPGVPSSHGFVPDDSIVDELADEMENMIIEANLRKDGGPLKSAWEAAVEKGRTLSSAMERKRLPSSLGKMPAPFSQFQVSQTVLTPGTLPSPRPSPPPLADRTLLYARARSVSC